MEFVKSANNVWHDTIAPALKEAWDAVVEYVACLPFTLSDLNHLFFLFHRFVDTYIAPVLCVVFFLIIQLHTDLPNTGISLTRS